VDDADGRTVDRRRRQVAAVLLAAVVFGLAAALLKGGDAGVRDSIGNISAPWLLLPYLAGTTVSGWKRGSLLGVIACVAAVAAFYVAESFVLDLGPHSRLTDLQLTVSSGRYYFAAAVIFGPVFGALGGIGKRRPLLSAAVVAFLLLGEPIVLFAWQGSQGVAPSDSGMVIRYPPLWMGEMIVGALLSLALAVRAARRPSRSAS
jgi:hypothetical protein